MGDVDAVLQQLRSLLGAAAVPDWPAHDFGPPIPPPTDWLGEAGEQAAQASRNLDAIRAELAQIHSSAGPLVQRAAQVSAFAKLSVDAIVTQWQADKAALAPYMNTGRGRAAYIQLGQARISDATQVVANTEHALSALAAQLNTAAARLPAVPPRSGDPADIPRWGSPAIDVRQWWEALTPAERDALVRERPDLLGQLGGLPSSVRDQANRAVMAADLDRVDSAAAGHHVSVAEIQAHPRDYGLTATDIVRYNNAQQARAGLEDQNRRTGAPAMLLIYTPTAFAGQGRAAIAIGNPDTADNVSVVVPGTSHSVAAGWLSAPEPANLYNAMQASSPQRNAVIAWMGYDAPDSFSDGRIASTGLAHEGGGLLAGDVSGFQAAAQTQPHYTVCGHSYGSTTVADAAWIGMPTTDVVLIGSPGTDMARSAADFHLPDAGHVYVGAASTDPISQLGKLPAIPMPGHSATIGLGPDPAGDDFGSIRFRAEVGGFTVNDHSHYYDPDSESLRSIALISTGQGATLNSQGLLAPARADLLDQVIHTAVLGPLGALTDLELPRIPGGPTP